MINSKADGLSLVSIIIPSFNHRRFLEKTLLSVTNQSYGNTEIIVIDGGSTDGTIELLEQYSDRLTYISEPDNGQSEAVNKGFSMAKGDIIGWLNSDDIYPDREGISRVVDAFAKSDRVSLVYGDFLEIDQNDVVLRIFRRPRFSIGRLLRIGYISQPATFFRRTVIEHISVNEGLHYAMDLDFWLAAHNAGFRFQHLPFLLAAERVHSEAKCVRDKGKMELEAAEVRRGYGAKIDRAWRFLRFYDKSLLYFYRLTAIPQLIQYERSPSALSVPLDMRGSIQRTMRMRMAY